MNNFNRKAEGGQVDRLSNIVNRTVDQQFIRFSFTGKNSGSASESSLTSSIKVIDAIIHNHNIRLLHSPIIPDPILLQGLRVEYCDLH